MAIAPDLIDRALDGRYELRALIGEGTFGRVYRGFDRRLERPVAIKVIKPWWAQDPTWVAGFEREARLLARLSAPGIVQIHDVGHAPEGLYYVSELIDGEDLAARLRRGPLAADEARAIALGLCDALAAAHAQRIVHRDIKPANVLLGDGDGDGDGDGGGRGERVTVADFGVARLAEATSHGEAPSAIVGTPRYMAPEQGLGDSLTPATDVYSVGVVLYEMLAGRPPFSAGTPVALALQHLHDPPPPLPAAIPAPMVAIVERALAKDSGARYRDAAEMAQALRTGARTTGARASSARATSARRAAARSRATAATGAAETLRAPGRARRVTVRAAARRRAAALLALAGALLGGLILAALLLSGGGHGRRAARGGPPVEVPLLVQENVTDAAARLRALGLRVRTVDVPAPGIVPGTVTRQRPLPGRTAPGHGVVRLEISEVPRWRPVTGFSTVSSPVIHIRGERWRILVTATDTRHCAFLGLFCDSSSLDVRRGSATGTALTRFGVGDGSGEVSTFASGPGSYVVQMDPASSSTRWSIRVQDDY